MIVAWNLIICPSDKNCILTLKDFDSSCIGANPDNNYIIGMTNSGVMKPFLPPKSDIVLKNNNDGSCVIEFVDSCGEKKDITSYFVAIINKLVDWSETKIENWKDDSTITTGSWTTADPYRVNWYKIEFLKSEDDEFNKSIKITDPLCKMETCCLTQVYHRTNVFWYFSQCGGQILPMNYDITESTVKPWRIVLEDAQGVQGTPFDICTFITDLCEDMLCKLLSKVETGTTVNCKTDKALVYRPDWTCYLIEVEKMNRDCDAHHNYWTASWTCPSPIPASPEWNDVPANPAESETIEIVYDDNSVLHYCFIAWNRVFKRKDRFCCPSANTAVTSPNFADPENPTSQDIENYIANNWPVNPWTVFRFGWTVDAPDYAWYYDGLWNVVNIENPDCCPDETQTLPNGELQVSWFPSKVDVIAYISANWPFNPWTLIVYPWSWTVQNPDYAWIMWPNNDCINIESPVVATNGDNVIENGDNGGSYLTPAMICSALQTGGCDLFTISDWTNTPNTVNVGDSLTFQSSDNTATVTVVGGVINIVIPNSTICNAIENAQCALYTISDWTNTEVINGGETVTYDSPDNSIWITVNWNTIELIAQLTDKDGNVVTGTIVKEGDIKKCGETDFNCDTDRVIAESNIQGAVPWESFWQNDFVGHNLRRRLFKENWEVQTTQRLPECYEVATENALPANALPWSVWIVCDLFEYFKDCDSSKWKDGWLFKWARDCEYDSWLTTAQIRFSRVDYQPWVTEWTYEPNTWWNDRIPFTAVENLVLPAPICDVENDAPQAFAKWYQFVAHHTWYNYTEMDTNLDFDWVYDFGIWYRVNWNNAYKWNWFIRTHIYVSSLSNEEFTWNDDLHWDSNYFDWYYKINQWSTSLLEKFIYARRRTDAPQERYDMAAFWNIIYELVQCK